jgi:amino acid transporter
MRKRADHHQQQQHQIMEEAPTKAKAAAMTTTSSSSDEAAASSSSRLHAALEMTTLSRRREDNNNNTDPLDGSRRRRRRRRCSASRRNDDINDGDDSASSSSSSSSLLSIQGGGGGSGGLARHLTFWDLLAIGVCGSIGSGIFVLVGLICHQHAGRASPLSWLLAGIAAATSSLCFAELAGHIPHSGSTYIYTCICWGQPVAVVSAACLTLEYGIAGAAVARTWGDKLVVYLIDVVWSGNNATAAATIQAWLLPFGGAIHVPAALASAASTWLLLAGVKESKQVTNIFTMLKMALVSFMIFGGLSLYRPPTAIARGGVPFAPYGAAGVLRGATSSFFGFIGYDEVCVVAGEALHPSRDLPRAVLGTVLIVTIVSVMAAFALSNMGIPYTDISSASGFPQAFSTRGVEWAAHLTSIGELICLPIVVLVSLMAQPRLTLAMAQDGILPASIFGTRHGPHQHHQHDLTTTNGEYSNGSSDSNLQPPPNSTSSPPGRPIPDPLLISPDDFNSEHNLAGGTMFAGVAMTIIAALVPFSYLDDLISSGILVAFSMANSCLILLRCEPRHHYNYATTTLADIQSIKLKCDVYVLVYNALCFVTSILWTHSWDWMPRQTFWATMSLLAWLACLLLIVYEYPASNHFGRYLLPAFRRARHQRQAGGHHQQLNHSDDSNGSDDSNNYNALDAIDSNTTTATVNDANFRAPCVPFVPCCGIAINWYLVAQLELLGLFLLALYLGMTLLCYHLCCSGNSNQHRQAMTTVRFIRRKFFSCCWWRHEESYEIVAASRATPSTGNNTIDDDDGAMTLVPVHSFT